VTAQAYTVAIREWCLKSFLRSALNLYAGERGKNMALVSLLARDQISIEDLQKAEKVIGRVLNFHKVVAHSPRALSGYLMLSEALKEMKLDRKLRELAYLRTAQLNRCPY
jgi:alkylhydroperoxidase family enzyme